MSTLKKPRNFEKPSRRFELHKHKNSLSELNTNPERSLRSTVSALLKQRLSNSKMNYTKNVKLSLLQNSIDGFCQSSVRIGEVVSGVYFEVVRDSGLVEE